MLEEKEKIMKQQRAEASEWEVKKADHLVDEPNQRSVDFKC